MFTRSTITPRKLNRFGWNLEHSEYIVGGWPWLILGAISAVATAGAPGEILYPFCQVSNARFHRFPVGQISRNLNTACRSVSRWKLSEQNFENVTISDRFYKKNAKQFYKINVLRLQAAITPQWFFRAIFGAIFNVLLWHFYSVLEVFFIYGTLNLTFLHYITLHTLQMITDRQKITTKITLYGIFSFHFTVGINLK